MALPKLDVPVYNLELPSTGKEIKYRPFLVKEQKLLLMASEGEDPREMVDSMRQIINNCCVEEIAVEELPLFDIEYIFLQLRSKSVGETSNVKFRCKNIIEEKECNGIVEIDIDLSKIKVQKNEKHNNKIKLTENLGMIMKYPRIELLTSIENLKENSMDDVITIIAQCIDSVYDSDEVYNSKDHTVEELQGFLLGMTQQQFEKVQLFFETMPRLKETVNFKCEKCKAEDTIELEGLQSFF